MNQLFVGVTVLPEYIQSEGIDGVLDNLVMKCRANAVTTSPYLMEEADAQTGQREPPADGGAGGVRLLDRPLWDKRELYVRTAPSFVPDKRFYQGLRYQPAEPGELTRRQGKLLADFIRAAQARHLKVYLQVQAAIPPGYRVQFGGPVTEDQPRLPNGEVARRRLAKNGSLASSEIRAYTQALIRDLCQAYPEIDGLRLDWPEYPPYFLDDVFLDFSENAQTAAKRLGFDFANMRAAAASLYRTIHGELTDDDLEPWLEPDGGRHALARFISNHHGVADWLRFKATLVEEFLTQCRRTLDDAGGGRIEFMPNAFPPPWTLASGLDFGRVAACSSSMSVKLYTMHWPMILRFYGDQIAAANPNLSRAKLTRVLVHWLDIADGEGLPRLEDYRYPEPAEPHPVGSEAMRRKIRQAQHEAGPTPIYALAHGYGPKADFERRLRAAAEASPHGFWVNRYGYLTDEKLEIIGMASRS